ncbi:MAG TPA: T9SS type A sorting domain-containing protein, partial [Chitinophagaceae bacterium]|nr:T9SS type A sorting domain-containing protein [Chitinophagaceae bacterium]
MCQNDTWLSQLDIDSSYTKNFYQGVGNVSFFYNYVNHAFPPCNTIDTFLQRVLTMPKVTASVDSDRCHMDSLFVNLQFEGQAPFQFQVVKDGQSIGSYLSSSNAMSISLSMEGNYVIDSLMDAQGEKGYRSDTIYYTKHPTPSLLTLSQHVVCDSQKTAIHFQCDGKSPWTLYYDRNSSLDSVLLDTSIDTVLWNNGNYHLITLRDANQCEIYLSSNITIDYELPNAMLQSKVFNCVSNQFILNWQSAGAFPLTLSYYDSTLSQSSSRLLTSPQMPLVFENGNYHFLAVKDSNQCVVTLDTTVKLFATPTSINAGPLNYMCSMPFASINVNYTGAPPFQLYLEDAMSSRVKMSQLPTDTLQLPFGHTIIHQMIDANGCITKLADTNFYNPNKPIQLNEVKATFGCDSQEFTVGMKVDATFPLTAYCRWNDSSFILQMPTSATVISLPAGRFRIDSLNDINSCYLTNLIDTQLYKIAPPVFQLQQSNFDLIAPYTPLFHEYKWFRNGLLIATTYDSVLHMTQQGRYFVEVIDSMNCTRQSQLLDVQLNNGLIFPNPFKDEITVFLEPDPGEKVQMAICDVAGRTLMKFNLTHNLTSLHLGALPKGNYVVHFFTNSPYKKYTSRHILKK